MKNGLVNGWKAYLESPKFLAMGFYHVLVVKFVGRAKVGGFMHFIYKLSGISDQNPWKGQISYENETKEEKDALKNLSCCSQSVQVKGTTFECSVGLNGHHKGII